MASNTTRATSGAKSSLSPRSGARILTCDSTRLTPWASVFRPPGFGNVQTPVAGEKACPTFGMELSVYLRGQTFHAGDDGALAAQLEAAIIARSVGRIGAFGLDGDVLPLLSERFLVEREVLAGGFLAIPLHG